MPCHAPSRLPSKTGHKKCRVYDWVPMRFMVTPLWLGLVITTNHLIYYHLLLLIDFWASPIPTTNKFVSVQYVSALYESNILSSSDMYVYIYISLQLLRIIFTTYELRCTSHFHRFPHATCPLRLCHCSSRSSQNAVSVGTGSPPKIDGFPPQGRWSFNMVQ